MGDLDHRSVYSAEIPMVKVYALRIKDITPNALQFGFHFRYLRFKIIVQFFLV